MPITTIDVSEAVEEAFQQDKPHNLLLWNDPINSQVHVAGSLMNILGLPIEKAMEIILIIEKQGPNGRAIVASNKLEVIELYHEQFKSVSLTTTIEKPD